MGFAESPERPMSPLGVTPGDLKRPLDGGRGVVLHACDLGGHRL